MGLTSFAAKTISIILAFLLCFSLCPVYAYAETENLSKETIEQSVPNTDSDSLESDRNANSSDNSKIDELQGETASDKTVDNSAEKTHPSQKNKRVIRSIQKTLLLLVKNKTIYNRLKILKRF